MLFALTASYTTYIFMPGHILMLTYYIKRALGYGDDSTVIGHDVVYAENTLNIVTS